VRAGFTIIDLLVSIGVIAVLLSVLVPAVTSAQAAAQRVACQSNIRQQAISMTARALEENDELPLSLIGTSGDGRTGPRPQDTLVVRFERHTGFKPGFGRAIVRWDNMGSLFSEGYLPAPEVYYCPAHAGEHPYERYAEAFRSDTGEIVTNYQFRAAASGKKLAKLSPDKTLLANAMRTRSDYSHGNGNNMLKADLSVQWFPDLNGELLDSLPVDESDTDRSASGVEDGWDKMDNFTPGVRDHVDHQDDDHHEPGG
jgi:competence protein ComGC